MPRDDRARWGQSTHTRAAVSFHTDEVGGFEAAEPIESHPDFGRILSVSTEKSMGAASGTFTVVVKTPQQRASAPRSWKRLWRDPEQVWVWIKFIVDGEVVDGMFGQIDSISEGTSRSGLGARSETFTITGRDFGKVFETTELFTNFYAAEAQIQGIMSQARLIRAGLENITGTPAHFIRFLVETWLSNNGIGEAQWTLPSSLGGNAFYEMLNLTTIQRMEDRLTNGELHNPNIIAIDQQGSKLWDSMQNLCHGLLNEMWVDLAPPPPLTPLPAAAFPTASIARVVNRPSPRAARPPLSGLVPSLYLRERPFPTRSDDNRHTNHAKWDSIRTRRLTPGDVASRQLARGGAAHRFNYWQLDATGLGSQDYGNVNLLQRGIEGVEPGFPGNNPIFNGQSMQLHGVRRYFQSTRFLPLRSTNSESEVWVRVAGRWLKKLHDWFSVAPFEVSGTITTSRLMPEIRIGERVKESRAEGTMVYYCEGVSNEWQYPNAGRTSLTLTRGEYEDENLLDYVYETFTSPSVLSARERCFVPPGQDTAELIATGLGRSFTDSLSSIATNDVVVAELVISSNKPGGFQISITSQNGGPGDKRLHANLPGDLRQG